jgi:signal transduction histidine kinase
MRSQTHSEFADRRTAATRVLLVSARRPSARWADGDGVPFEVHSVRDAAAAATLLHDRTVDAVVLDPERVGTEADLPERLREACGCAALLVRASEVTTETARLLRRLGGAALVLPATAPAPVQAQLVCLAAARARLESTLAARTAELERRTRELDRSRARFRDVIERNADAILVVGREGVIRFANAVAAELFQRPREELVGTPFGFPLVLGETTELDLLRDGRVRVVEMRVVGSGWEGEAASIASLRDITRRRRAEADARRLIRAQAARSVAQASARRFRFLAEATTRLSMTLDFAETLSTLAQLFVAEIADWAVAYVVDETGAVNRLDVTHRAASKTGAAEAIRAEPIDPAGPHPVLEALRTRTPILVREVAPESLRAVAQDEKHLALLRTLGVASYMVVPLVARDHPIGAIALVSSSPSRPFTEQDLAEANDLALRAALALDNARLYEEAKRANRAKTDLLAAITHDLRTPVAGIMGHVDLLQMGIPEKLGDASLQRVGRIRLGAAHLLFLIDELLSFAGLEAGREELRLREVDAAELAREVAAVIEPLALGRSLGFHLELPDAAVPSLHTDPDRLRQVLLNLVGNAVKYTEAGDVRLVVGAEPERGVVFQVCDTGIGIEPEHLGDIFEPFWRVPSDRHRSGGSGIGLSVVQRLVRLLRGEVAVRSEKGRGSVFSVRLPLRITPTPPRTAEPRP